MAGHYFKFNFDASAWRAAAGFGDAFEHKSPSGSWLTWENINVTTKSKILIAPNQPINTKVFEEAVVLEENGALTNEGMKEYQGDWVSEFVYKPLIDFLNR